VALSGQLAGNVRVRVAKSEVKNQQAAGSRKRLAGTFPAQTLLEAL
jgi:hypothetical protein